MKAAGLIVEYNPFHNGHAYHASKSREQTGADVIAAVMSGPFLQRGEPALVSKWARTEMALLGGVDLVVELPFAFAAQNAEVFARGSISILEALGCTDFCFGSEAGSLGRFLDAYVFREEHEADYRSQLKKRLKEGLSYPKASSLAYEDLSGDRELLDLSQPNNILGFEYVKTALKNHFSIRPATIQRIKTGYHDTKLAGSIASATGIRKALLEDGQTVEEVSAFIPEGTASLLMQHKKEQNLLTWENFWPLLQYRLVTVSAEELASAEGVEEGVEYRLKAAAPLAQSFQDFIEKVKTKRYTRTRLQRICVHILAGLSKEEAGRLQRAPSYIRILGMNQKGRAYLNQIKKRAPLPLISRLAAFKDREADTDIRASQLYALGAPGTARQALLKREFQAPVYLAETPPRKQRENQGT